MGSRVWRYVAIGVALVAAVALVVVLTSGGEDARSADDAWNEWTSNTSELSEPMQEEAIEGAEEEEIVREVLAGHAVEEAEASSWMSPDGKALVGAVVVLHLAEPLDLDAVEVPAFVTPGPNAPKPPIPLRRRVAYTGTGIDELEFLMSMPRREILEVEPHGGSIQPPKMVGIQIGPGYKEVGEH